MIFTIVTIVFPPEPGAQTLKDIAEEMSKRGHQVTVIAPFPNRPSGHIMPGYQRRWKMTEKIDNYTVIHSWHTLSRKSAFFSRFFENFSFGITSTWRILNLPKPDVVYLYNWPVFAAGMNSWALKNLISKDTKIVNNVRDIYPESLLGKKMIRENGFIAKTLRWLDKADLRRADVVITLSPSMKELLIEDRGLPPDKVLMLPNWLDAGKFSDNLTKYGTFRQKHGIPKETFLAIFAGTITLSAGLDLYIKAAEILQNNDKIQILLVGEGSERKRIEAKIAEKRLKNIRCIYPMLPEEVPQVQAAADVLLLSLTGEMSHSAAPSKQIAYMFSGRPILASITGTGTPASIIADSKSGFVLPPGNPQAVADKLIELSENPEGLEGIGENARNYARNNFAKDVVMPKLINLFESLAEN